MGPTVSKVRGDDELRGGLVELEGTPETPLEVSGGKSHARIQNSGGKPGASVRTQHTEGP